MSYPPPPGQQPNNPYAAPQQGAPGAPGAPYGYPQQGAGQPNYGYPGGIPAYPAGPGGPMRPTVSMPGVVVTARVLLFIAGALWALLAFIVLTVGLAANDALDDVPVADSVGSAALGGALVGLLIFGGMAALHIVPAAMFGKGRIGTRVTAIIAGSLNALIPLVAVFGAMGSGDSDVAGTIFMCLLWLATAVLTIVFCSMSAAGQWFNRPQY
ncbi:proline-rich domain-containing protein [Streptomyces sp. 891-h]|uniref:proline-rich domain-containing protein n=1 Tax=Streptomyces sp. 891-h TaxID=2720714 RepID=UPI001FAAA3CD|nr:proline-rich domain-containing protein [Streptomyces sp. 891-h]UNZ17704.1 hypothetical protein HC362_12195 [Streptomyces sp. 891-h]